jgi:hypothetical protein
VSNAVSGAQQDFENAIERVPRLDSTVGALSLMSFYTLLVIAATVYMSRPVYDGYFPHTVYLPPLSYAAFVCLLAIFPAVYLPRTYRRPSQVILWWLYPVAYIPILTLHAVILPDQYPSFAIVVALSFYLLTLPYRLPTVRIRDQFSRPVFWRLLLLGTLAILGLLVAVFGRSLSITGDIYEVRYAFRDRLQSFGPIFYRIIQYGSTWLENVFVPLLLIGGIAGLTTPLMIAVAIGGALTVFAIGGFKSAFFGIVVGIGLYIALHDDGSRFAPYALLAGPLTLSGLLLIDYLGAPTDFLSLGRRTLLTPGYMTAYHVEFFSQNPHTHI